MFKWQNFLLLWFKFFSSSKQPWLIISKKTLKVNKKIIWQGITENNVYRANGRTWDFSNVSLSELFAKPLNSFMRTKLQQLCNSRVILRSLSCGMHLAKQPELIFKFDVKNQTKPNQLIIKQTNKQTKKPHRALKLRGTRTGRIELGTASFSAN